MDYNDKQIKILEAAEKLFAENGFKGTSVRDIAQAADINLAMVSYYFGSKNKLLEAIFNYRSINMKNSLESLVKKESLTSIEKINKMIELYVLRVMSQQPFFKIYTGEMVVSNTTEMEKLILGIKIQNLNIIKEIINKGQKDGSFKKNIDLPLLINTLSGTANNLISSQKYYKILSELQDMPEAEFQKVLVKKLTAHLKTIFKILIVNEI